MLSYMFADVIVLGAGPVGLLAANLLGRRGLHVILVERDADLPSGSRAIGVSPPSLEILSAIGLDKPLVAAGVAIKRVQVHGKQQRLLGTVSFDSVGSAYPFILAVPQPQTMHLLGAALRGAGKVDVCKGSEVTSLFQDDRAVYVVRRYREGEVVRLETLGARFVLACDGSKSFARKALGLKFAGRHYRDTFLMGDFPDNTGWENEARLFFTSDGSVEAFPLPQGLRRWIVLTDSYKSETDTAVLASLVEKRTGFSLDPSAARWMSPFGTEGFMARKTRIGRVFLAGDAAHVLSPIGGQGMNTGFADVAAIAGLIAQTPESVPVQGAGFRNRSRSIERSRLRAFRVARNRAWRSMKLGVVRGRFASVFRNLVLRVYLRGPWKKRIPVDYAMMTIPGQQLVRSSLKGFV